MFNWSAYLDLAECLARGTDDEAARRTAISRAYYAAYHAAARYVRDHGLVQTRHPHESVWKALANDADPTRVSVGTRGLEMKRARITADYLNPFPDDLALKVRDTAISARYVTATLDCLG